MSPETSEVVERMYEVLVEEIRNNRPELLDEPFSVAEIYQNLVPYRTHRDRIGTEMNGDYEHALIRLLAGAGEYLELDSDAARRRLREELGSTSPDTGIYRNFAACEVRLKSHDEASAATVRSVVEGARSGRTDEEEEGDDVPSIQDRRGVDPSVSAEKDRDGGRVLELQAREESGPTLTTDAAGASDADTGGSGTSEQEPDDTCRWCRERLPDREDLRFCPFCGSRTDLVPCPECGTELETDWLFCLACGTEV